MQLNTLSTARNNRGILTVTGKCPESDEMLDYINSGIQRLLVRGDWYQTLFRIEICVHDECITWPKQVGKIRAMNICNASMMVMDQWASFTPFRPPGCGGNVGVGGVNDWFVSTVRVENRALVPIFRQIPCGAANWYVRLYIERLADIGKTCTIYGVDTHGNILRSIKADGVYSEGVTIVASNPFGSTSIPIRKIERVFFNEPFEGNSRLYGYDADANVLHKIGMYEPGETEPSYVYSRIIGGCRLWRGNCNGVRSVEALAKLNPDPLVRDTELLQIQNLEALKLAIQAIRKEEAGEIGASEACMARAVREMNRVERDWIPDYQIPINTYPFGGAFPTYHRIGLIS